MSTSPVAATVSSIVGTVNTASVTEFVATNNQTTFTISYTIGEILVFLNGVLLDNEVDYVATNGTTVVLQVPAATDDVVTIDTGTLNFTSQVSGGFPTEAFKTISVSGSDDVVADTGADTLTLAAAGALTIATTAGSDTVTFTGTGAANAFKTIVVSGQSDVVADAVTDTLTLVAGTNMAITTAAGSDTVTFTNTQVAGATVDDATALAIALG